jgi:heptosyltransferase-2
MNRILLVQTAFLGDVVLTTPLLRELRRAHPAAEIVVLTTPLGAEALQGLPYINERISFDKDGHDRGMSRTWELGRRLRMDGFDVGIAAQRSFRTGLLLRLAGTATRIGFEGAPGAWAYTKTAHWNADDHAVRRYLALAGPAGGDPRAADPHPELAVLPQARETVDRLLIEAGVQPSDPILAVAPGSIWGTKRWTPEGYAEVVRSAMPIGLKAVLVGSPAERTLCEEIAKLAGGGYAILAGRSKVPELAALLARSRALVTNDSGPGHVASAVGTPVVTIFGPTVPAFGYAPFGVANRLVEHPSMPCRPCHPHGPKVCPLGHHRCMREITPQTVLRAIHEVVG